MWFEGYAWREYVSSRSRSGYLIDTAEKSDRLQLLLCPICGDDWLPAWKTRVNDPLGQHLEKERDADDLLPQETA